MDHATKFRAQRDTFPGARVESMRASGASWRTIAKELGVGIGTERRAAQARAKNVCGETFDSSPQVLHV